MNMRRKIRQHNRYYLLAVTASMLVFPGAPARAEVQGAAPVALVTELSGKAETQADGKATTVLLLSEFRPTRT